MEPYLAAIIMFGGNFAPMGWAFLNGQAMPISQNTALYSLLGTTYGGDGVVTFNLPDMRGRVPMHPGSGPGLSNHGLGEKGGAETVTLTYNQLPAHTHSVSIGIASGTASAGGNGKVLSDAAPIYTDAQADKALRSPSVVQAGGNQPISILPPYLCVNFVICTDGIYPSRN